MKNKTTLYVFVGFIAGILASFLLKGENIKFLGKSSFCAKQSQQYLEKIRKDEGENLTEEKWEKYVEIETKINNLCNESIYAQ